jgi:hypothetical protein
MIEQLTGFPDNVAAFRCTGDVTKVLQQSPGTGRPRK